MKNAALKSNWCLLFAFILTASLFGQRATGTAKIQGRVTDEEGKPIPEAVVTLKSLDVFGKTIEGFEKTAKTNKKGVWKMHSLGSGECFVRASAEGYRTETIRISISQVYPNETLIFKLEKASEIVQTVESPSFEEEGHQLYQEGKYEQAVASYKLFLKDNPASFETYYFIGNCFLNLGDVDRAQIEYMKVIEGTREEAIPESAKIQALAATALGNIYLDRNIEQTAIKYFKKSLEFNPRNEGLAYNLGEMLFSAGNNREAVVYFKNAAEIDPAWPDPYLKLGYVYSKMEDYSQAREYFSKFLELKPDDSRAEEIKTIIKDLERKRGPE